MFDDKIIKPMLIGEEQEAFDDDNYIFELKLDGERCIAILTKEKTELRNKRSNILTKKFPELNNINKQVKKDCILDGELIVIKNGVPDFFEVQKRTLMSNKFKIELSSSQLPASFTAYDILYYDGKQVTDLPLMKRKELLQKVVKENERLAISRYIEKQGKVFYSLAEKNNLEGIVAKKKDSLYYFGKRTKDWIKIKYLKDDDFIICGYILKEKGIISIVLGQYEKKKLTYKGHVTMGISKEEFKIIDSVEKIKPLFKPVPKGNENAVWIKPELVCTVKYMMKTESGGLRQPVFKGLRMDKSAHNEKNKS